MISDVPAATDFIGTGLSLLNFAWDTVATLMTDLDDSEYFGVDIPEVSDAFWEASKQRLTTALAVAQQGVEFILKGRIAEISPFLLLAGTPREWPKACNKNDTSFAEFRTIDSQDLLRVHDTVAASRLTEEFVAKFDELRRKRNAIMHTVDKRINVHVVDVVGDILSVYKHLFPAGDWVKIRREFLEKSPMAELHSTDFVETRVIWEFSLVTELLTPQQMKEFFGFNKRQRRYICPKCYHESGDSEIRSRTALLKPNTAQSTTIYCFVCDETIAIERTDCQKKNCPGNVLSEEYGICTTCGGHIG
jgi:hypothetical protein